MLWHIELKFYRWICFVVLQIKFECCEFASIFRSIASFGIYNIGNTQFSSLFSYVLWHLQLTFFIWLCLMYFKSRSSAILCVRLNLCPSIHFLHVPPTCIDKFSWNLKFDVGFLYAFLLEKYYYKNSFLKYSWRAYYAPFAVLRYFCIRKWNFNKRKRISNIKNCKSTWITIMKCEASSCLKINVLLSVFIGK